VNYLLECGHDDAGRYTFARVWNEARSARRRKVNQLETEALLMQSVIGSCLSKDGQRHFRDTLKRLKESGDGGAS
jgi:hypothetical protein